jgi:hypothetical protein
MSDYVGGADGDAIAVIEARTGMAAPSGWCDHGNRRAERRFLHSSSEAVIMRVET